MTTTIHITQRPMPGTQNGMEAGGPIDLIVALDVDHGDAAMRLVDALGDDGDFYKVGLELFTAEGPAVVRRLRSLGKRVFVDLKLHDIPNTVRGAARSVARLGASLLTVHASGGEEMIRAAVAGASAGSAEYSERNPDDQDCGILAVTVLTSLNEAALGTIWGRTALLAVDEVKRLASLARSAGARGIVCSGHEVGAVKADFGDALDVLVPGIRPNGGAVHDQARVVTPEAAARDGARWLVLGRAVTEAPDPRETLRAIRQSVDRIRSANQAG